VSRELEDQVDDGPIGDNELDGPENGENEESDPAEPVLGSLDGRDDQTAWAAGDRRDLELDPAESGIADYDGLGEQIGSQDWRHGGAGVMTTRKQGREPKPKLSPEIAALARLSNEGAGSNAAIRRRIALITAERKLDHSETQALTKGRWLRTYDICQFAKKHHVSVDWLIGGDLKAYPRRSALCQAMTHRPRAMSGQEFVAALAMLDEKSRQFIIGYMQLLVDGGGAA